MNGYQLTADSYREYLKKNPKCDEAVKKDMEHHIKANEFLATCTDEDIFKLFDSSAFNSILKGYVLKAVTELSKEKVFSKETGKKVVYRCEGLLDQISASEASRFWYEN